MINLDELRSENRLRLKNLESLLKIAKELENKQKEPTAYCCLCSSICLAAYNQVEYLTRQIILNVCDSIIEKEKHYFDIQQSIQNHLSSIAKKENYQKNIESLLNRIACLYKPETDKITDGNIGFKKLKQILDSYHINIPKWPTSPPLDLDTLKDIRNNLAHGKVAFSENHFISSDLEKFIKYLEELSTLIIDNLEICINAQTYCKHS